MDYGEAGNTGLKKAGGIGLIEAVVLMGGAEGRNDVDYGEAGNTGLKNAGGIGLIEAVVLMGGAPRWAARGGGVLGF